MVARRDKGEGRVSPLKNGALKACLCVVGDDPAEKENRSCLREAKGAPPQLEQAAGAGGVSGPKPRGSPQIER